MNKTKHNIILCQACLSTNRRLTAIDEFSDVFNIISSIKFNTCFPVYVCWECMAMLKKIQLFKAKIEEAQRILAYHFVNKEKSLLKSLSWLTRTHTDDIITITHDDDDIKETKPTVEIIQGINYDDHNNYDDHTHDDNYDQDPSDFCHVEIKKEKNIDTKSMKSNKELHYKIVYESNDKWNEKALQKRITINEKDVKKWMNKERNSEFYKSFKFKCKLCLHGFFCEEKLKKHVKKYHDESLGAHVCSACNARFSSETMLRAHALTHNSAWECARCGFQCYTQRRLKAHLTTHYTVKCVDCEASFIDMPSFYSHYKQLHTIFICDRCGRRCKSKLMIAKHISRHEASHSCASCPRRYKSSSALRKHAALQHGGARAEDAYCVLCDKQYRSPGVYLRHVQSSAAHAHERDLRVKKRVQCPQCSNSYSRRTYMMNHFRHVHLNQSKHFCTLCDRHFLNRTRYVEHVRYNHEGMKREKNKLCNICGRGFAAKRTLVNHIRTHSGERPYECEYCSAKFTQRTSMMTHIKFVHMKSKRRAQWPQ